MGYIRGEGYHYLLGVARDEQANEDERLAAIQALVDLGDKETLDDLITIHKQPATINFKQAVLASIGELEGRIGHGRKDEDRLGDEQF